MPGETDVEQLLAKQDWNAITMKLTLFAHRRLGSRSIETAREVAQEALTRIWDAEYKEWDPAKEPDLLGHLRSVVNGIVSNIWKLSREKSERSTPPDQLARQAELAATADGRTTDDKIDAAAFLDRLLQRTDGDELVTELIFLMSDGMDTPAEQATHLKRERKHVYNANRRLGDHVAAIRADLHMEGDDDL